MLLALLLVANQVLTLSALPTNVYVDGAHGSDANAGADPAHAVRTLTKARDLGSASGVGATIHVAPGSYALASPLALGANNKGLSWKNDGAGQVTVSGGTAVVGWQRTAPTSAVQARGACAANFGTKVGGPVCCGQSGTVASARYICPEAAPHCVGFVQDRHYGSCTSGPVPPPPPPPPPLAVVSADVTKLGLTFTPRHLFVNGARARRARLTPAQAEGVFAGAKLTDAGFTLGSASVNATAALREGAEFVYPQSTSPWTEPRCAVQAVNATHVDMMQPCWANLVHKACRQSAKGPPTGGQNYVEAVGKGYIAAPGDWAIERGTMYYALRDGETAATIAAVVPMLEVLVTNVGADDVSFEGFTFEHGTWLRPGQGDGYVEQQTGNCAVGTNHQGNSDCVGDRFWSVKSPGNVQVTNASRVSFTKCEFTRLGGAAALDFTCATDAVVDSCYFHDVSGAGIQIGQFVDPLAANLDTGTVVRNTVVNRAGVEYRGAAGINLGYTQGAQIVGNDVSNMSYVPISAGWGWSRHACGSCTNAANNTIAFNRAHDYKQVMNDGGGIYMLGPQNGSLIHRNWVYNQGTATSGALYPDEGSAYSTWSSNVVTNIGSSQWLHLWTGSIHNVSVIDNFADTKTFDNKGTNCPMSNNTVFEPGSPPPAAVAIMKAAGVNSTNPWQPAGAELV